MIVGRGPTIGGQTVHSPSRSYFEQFPSRALNICIISTDITSMSLTGDMTVLESNSIFWKITNSLLMYMYNVYKCITNQLTM